VLEALLTGVFREAVLALVDTEQPTARRARTAVTALGETMPNRSMREALDEMTSDRSEVVRSIASHYLATLGPVEGAAEVRTLA
jgi:HEAT repeat protein